METNNRSNCVRQKVIIIFSFLVILNIIVWATAFLSFYKHPSLLALCLLAYGFGLRHAVDADHIAAIDNVTRKFMQQKKSPVTIGFFFSLGHSTIVIIMTFFVALGTVYIHNNFPAFQKIGGIVAISVSASFLLLIAFINFIIFIDIYKVFRGIRKDKKYSHQELEDLFDKKGLLSRFFRPLFNFVSRSWHMYIIGFLFGLGFDTASEVALLGISATQAANGVPVWTIMIFPLLFMAGMCVIDTLDGVLMLGIYGWAFLKPMRKLFYNMTITLVSFMVAFIIGGLEALSIISSQLNLNGGIWFYINKVNDNFGNLGYMIIGIFIVSWLVSTFIYKYSKINSFEYSAE
ncbi:MAG TPA: HoxN/HupN/NixA family nickel/cobalt transporter [Victivallales bacterium]|nr:HoxN/HupN/NixA family nickel/cobalt transporter [Victivallales bacterium]